VSRTRYVAPPVLTILSMQFLRGSKSDSGEQLRTTQGGRSSRSCVDSIEWLKDSDLFHHELSKEVRSNPSQSSGSTRQDPLSDRDTVINALGTPSPVKL
jgi:hypothetical protein